MLPGHFMPKDMGLLDFNTSDGRFLFLAPWQGHMLVGTTDKKGPAKSFYRPPEEDVEWLTQETQKYLRKDMPIQRSHVLSAWRGWRPLAVDPHAPPNGAVSRDHVISENPETGVLFIAGGKWTTWREMAQDVIDRIVGQHGPCCKTMDLVLHGGDGYSDKLASQLVQRYNLDEKIAEHLVNTYGGRAWEVCDISKNLRLVEGYPYIESEVVYACREYACTIEDVLSRRTPLAFLNRDAALEVLPNVAEIMAEELGWSTKVKEAQIDDARTYISSFCGPELVQEGTILEKEAAYL